MEATYIYGRVVTCAQGNDYHALGFSGSKWCILVEARAQLGLMRRWWYNLHSCDRRWLLQVVECSWRYGGDMTTV